MALQEPALDNAPTFDSGLGFIVLFKGQEKKMVPGFSRCGCWACYCILHEYLWMEAIHLSHLSGKEKLGNEPVLVVGEI